MKTVRLVQVGLGVAVLGLAMSACAVEPSNSSSNAVIEVSNQIGPLDVYYSRIFGRSATSILETESLEDAQAELQAQLNEELGWTKEFIASCMAEQGFSYVPNPNAGMTVSILPEDQIIPADSREFAETYGFGISNEPTPRVTFMGGPGISGFGIGPNQAAVDAMSEAEQAAWWTALRGWWTPADIGDDFDQNNPAHFGCRGLSWEARGALDPFDRQLDGLRDEIARLREQVLVDPRVLAANAAWFTCMSAAGYAENNSPPELQASINADWRRLQGWDSDEETEAPTWDQTLAFREREVTLAVASWDCQAAANLPGITREVDLDLQQQFVDRNRDELERWAQLAEEHRASR